MAVATEPQWLRDRKRIMAICSSFSLGRGERIEIATTLLNREVTSYSDLSPLELATVRTALEGAVLVCAIQLERRARQRR